MKVAVIGAGIFGCISAIKLKQKFPKYQVHLFERHPGICHEASGINQYRLHEGYHYPRSPETAIQCKSGTKSFLTEFGDCIVNNLESQYCIANHNSIISAQEFLDFLRAHDLPYYISKESSPCLNYDNLDVSIFVSEFKLNLPRFKVKMLEDLRFSKVICHLNTNFHSKDVENYDLVVNCTYSNLNSLLNFNEQVDYQFELCEKPVVELDYRFKQKSFVIMDGPFMCIDPLAETGLHVLGHVKHAIHHTNTGKFPIVPVEFTELLNIGICNPKITNFQRFVESGQEFFTDFNPKHIGSMYTIRTVMPNRDYDDARPSYITKHNDKLYSIFSGKISTAVEIANQLVNTL